MARTIELLDDQLVVLGVDDPGLMARTIAARAGAPLRSAEVVPAPDPAGRGDEPSPAP